MNRWYRRLIAPPSTADPDDPFAHPQIAAMSQRELADLPLVPPPASAPSRSRHASP